LWEFLIKNQILLNNSEILLYNMNQINFSEIRNLPADEKIKTLKKIDHELREKIQKNKKELEEKKREIEEAEFLLQEAEDEYRLLEQIRIQEPKKIQIDKLFNEEKGEKLEEMAKEQVLQQREERVEGLANKPVEELYNMVIGMSDEVKQTGIQTQYQQELAQDLKQAFYHKREVYQENPAQKAQHLLTAAEQIMNNYL